MELVNEGRLLSHAMRERIVMTTSEAFVIVSKLDEISRQKHLQFVELCRLTEATYNENDKLQDQLLLATKRRDFSVARNVIQKVNTVASFCYSCTFGKQPPELFSDKVVAWLRRASGGHRGRQNWGTAMVKREFLDI